MATGAYDTGWQRFGVATNEDLVGPGPYPEWTNPGNILVSNGETYNSVPGDTAYGTGSDHLRMLDYWPSANDVPADAVIKTVEIRSDVKCGGGDKDLRIQMNRWANGSLESFGFDPYSLIRDDTWRNAVELLNWDIDGFPGLQEDFKTVARALSGYGLDMQVSVENSTTHANPTVATVRNLEVRFTYDSVTGPGVEAPRPFTRLLGAF